MNDAGWLPPTINAHWGARTDDYAGGIEREKRQGQEYDDPAASRTSHL